MRHHTGDADLGEPLLAPLLSLSFVRRDRRVEQLGFPLGRARRFAAPSLEVRVGCRSAVRAAVVTIAELREMPSGLVLDGELLRAVWCEPQGQRAVMERSSELLVILAGWESSAGSRWTSFAWRVTAIWWAVGQGPWRSGL